jgi:hypothetical protein
MGDMKRQILSKESTVFEEHLLIFEDKLQASSEQCKTFYKIR